MDRDAGDGDECDHAGLRRASRSAAWARSPARSSPDLLVGVVIALTIQFKPEASGAVMYLFMALMLLLRPRGLLGERWERFE